MQAPPHAGRAYARHDPTSLEDRRDRVADAFRARLHERSRCSYPWDVSATAWRFAACSADAIGPDSIVRAPMRWCARRNAGAPQR